MSELLLFNAKWAIFQLYHQGFQSGTVPGTFTHLRSCIVPAEINEPPKISGGQKPQVQLACGIFFIKKLMITSIAEFSHSNFESWRDIPYFKNNFTLEL
jgi:hypothetical protein